MGFDGLQVLGADPAVPRIFRALPHQTISLCALSPDVRTPPGVRTRSNCGNPPRVALAQHYTPALHRRRSTERTSRQSTTTPVSAVQGPWRTLPPHRGRSWKNALLRYPARRRQNGAEREEVFPSRVPLPLSASPPRASPVFYYLPKDSRSLLKASRSALRTQ